jgi:hypothetical protein
MTSTTHAHRPSARVIHPAEIDAIIAHARRVRAAEIRRLTRSLFAALPALWTLPTTRAPRRRPSLRSRRMA